MLAMNAPGQLSYDSVTQLADGRSGSYNSWHPPLMAFLLGLFDRVVPGTGLFLLFQSGLLLAALLALVSHSSFEDGPRGWLTPLIALAIVLTPQWLLYQGEIWKDVLFADAAIAGFVALAVAGRSGTAADPGGLHPAKRAGAVAGRGGDLGIHRPAARRQGLGLWRGIPARHLGPWHQHHPGAGSTGGWR